jgi:N-acetylglucosamine kinase-like BadF-type ATPase
MKYVLAVDGGGTKTQVWCADQTGQIIGEGFSGPTSLTATSVGAASFNLREAIRQAMEKIGSDSEVACMVMGLAGMDTPPEEANALKVFQQEGLKDIKINQFVLVNDSLIGLESGTDKSNALVLISGTGSNCLGRNEEGHTAKTSGMDYILTDQGSGYEIGLMVLKEAVKSFDGRGPKTSLENLVCEYFHIQSVNELKAPTYNPALTKPEVADLARLCVQAYDSGDQVAKNIFDHAITELNLMVRTVAQKLNMTDRDLDIVLAGSVTKNSYVQEGIRKHVAEYCANSHLVIPTKEPVFGALKMSLKLGLHLF